jgi:hypothetical protein
MFDKIEKLFFNLTDAHQLESKYEDLNPDRKQLFKNIIDRLLFDNYLETNFPKICRFINPKFLRSLQGYLILSCGDALGKGAKFYPIQNYVFGRNNPERDEIIDQFLLSGLNNKEQVNSFLKAIIESYKEKQSVKQSFFSFWESRSKIIKEKLFACYNTPFDKTTQKYSEQNFYNLIKKRLYEVYRNPFTHRAESNFPQSPPDPRSIQDPNLAKMCIWTELHCVNNKTFEFRVPLSTEEAEKILSLKGDFYHRLLDDSLMPLSRPKDVSTVIGHSVFARGGIPDKDGEGKNRYVHPGTLDVLRMAIVEACCDMISININWLSQYS